MKRSIRKLIAILLSIVGTLLTVYIGAYLLLFRPIIHLYHCYLADAFTLKILFVDLVKIFFSATAGGAVWCIFDIVAGFFRDED